MTATKRLSRPFLHCLVIIFGAMLSVNASQKFNINNHAEQIFKIAEDTVHSINGIEIVLQPSHFNYLVPFTTTVTCNDGQVDLSGMEHTHMEETYMEAINETHSYLQGRFAIAEASYKYDFCWVNFGIPIPISLRGKVLHSHFFVSAVIHYKPKCKVDITEAQLLSYGRLTVNIFQWMPEFIGDWLLDAITRNAQDQIFATVEKSIRLNTEALTDTYNPCIVFPSMGKMTLHDASPQLEESQPKEKLLEDANYIGDLLDEIEKQEELQDSENTINNENAKTEL